jgi:hypothetical protein
MGMGENIFIALFIALFCVGFVIGSFLWFNFLFTNISNDLVAFGIAVGTVIFVISLIIIIFEGGETK